ncbi:hypothetical protein COV53_00670 [Candidatus Gottesmanbacteria bacterium CG11_big_fil_rev_8_21_14_0_20_37_11]|uniref:Phospholipid/glycerol acyltransferase domain-containing protein n=3 Tax=Candidatus Gottesmaniibacteriota TaxID=1752720 RepID=A0A2M7RRZ7_9BACT|nr:MAG: hypothetical protein AUJ73_04390 [Candidatus Gottesmanbacteria bacterium CG1_02_37_22]PIP32689.1 MAG: hypothetical protein COX23_03375 [Candidatus Gottesmanbacteria bacterium CG23_combo_of_CG06-09_8_20_14_all_37_19]PIR08879.1 MAG: hypothetical protein COV53_00670 [Candidatus Gottesmanbacteria bacterium CG11_big_fil_rev_8_21_14_0_20_37_11]PIZ03098.1 MAG: hypothetical protein COY59_01155 [Candidatus Gottesmanbacteria bacterium CG_4_10_14_0_8_um_filter_37_24]
MSNIHKLPIIGKFIKTLDRDIKKYGWQDAARRIIKYTNTSLEIIGKYPKLDIILAEKGVIIVANHPFEAETIALIASLPTRKDTYLMVNAMFTGLGNSIDKHLIPVYIRHHKNPKIKKRLLKKIMDTFHPQKEYSPDIEHKKNIININKASQIVRKGGLVIIYPGRRSTDGKWFDGVGYFIKGVGKSKNTYIVQVYSEGTSNWDYLRLHPLLGKILPKVKIYFSRELPINKFISENAKEIKNKLEDNYCKWLSTIGKNN